MHYPDLGLCDAYGAKYAAAFLAVGWLGEGLDYPRGTLTPQEHHALATLIRQDFALTHMFGLHACEYCGQYLSGTDLFVPVGAHVLLAPGGILHYVEVHGYLPPALFRKAVLECPPLASREYFAALLKTDWAPIARGDLGNQPGHTLEAELERRHQEHVEFLNNPGLDQDDPPGEPSFRKRVPWQHPLTFAILVLLLSGIAIVIAYFASR